METTVTCPICSLAQGLGPLQPGEAADCRRCGAILRERRAVPITFTLALALAALILYVPANVYPILRMNLYGAYSENTIWEGIRSLFEHDEALVGVIVFAASIVIPLLKLVALFFLALTAGRRSARWRPERTRLYRLVVAVGPWAMLDVFLLAVLVALVKLQSLATILPGPGLLAFTAVVVLTILASASFDPRLIWESPEAEP